MRAVAGSLFLGLSLVSAATAGAGGLALGPRMEMAHRGLVHEIHVSPVAIAADGDGRPLVAWFERDDDGNALYAARPWVGEGPPVRVNPVAMPVDSFHQAPGLAVGPGGEIYLSWSSAKEKPEGTLFASDLRLSRSRDGGRTFDAHLRVNDDRPLAHSFEGLSVTRDGTVLASWIDSRDGWERAGTYLARIADQGTRVDRIVKVAADTCVCCRVSAAAGPRDAVALLWRKVFPGDIRDMVVGLSRDGGRSFADPARVHADRWQISACPHRGGTIKMDGSGRVYAAWYTEGTSGRPDLLFAVARDGRVFGEPRRLQTSTTSVPDTVRMAVDDKGRALLVWEDSTAVRRRILVRSSTDGGRSLSPVRVLSTAVKAYAPDVAVSRPGEFIVAWQEEQFPMMKTVVQPVSLAASR